MTRFLIFFIVELRLNIVFVILIGSYFAKNIKCQHAKILKIILRYMQDLKK